MEINKMVKRFECWDLTLESFKLTTLIKENSRGITAIGVSVELPEFDISVSSYSEKSQKGNLKRCFDMLEAILNNYML